MKKEIILALLGILICRARGFYGVCPSKWTKLGSTFYMLPLKTYGTVSWEDAGKFCHRLGGTLLEIDSQEEQDIIKDYTQYKTEEELPKSRYMAFWLGITDLKEEGVWRLKTTNTDVSKIVQSFWGPDQPKRSREDNCAAIVINPFNSDNAEWVNLSCDGQGYPACELGKIDTSSNATSIAGICHSPWTKVGSSFYMFPYSNSDTVALKESDKYCHEQGGKLLEIDSQEEQEAIADYVSTLLGLEYAGSHYWLGVSDYEEEGKWRLITSRRDVTSLAESLWKPYEQPVGGNWQENCAYMHLSVHAVHDVHAVWKVTSCDSWAYTICEKDPNDTSQSASSVTGQLVTSILGLVWLAALVFQPGI